MKNKIDREIKDLVTDVKVIKAQKKLCDEALFWLSVAQIYLDSKTLSGISECDRI